MSRQNWEQLVQNLIAGGILRSPQVIRAMRQVNRALFLPDNLKAHYAVDSPLPIGEGQTVSAPHDQLKCLVGRNMVSIMNEALELEVGHKVLEIGAGSGWHAATVAEIVAPSDIAREKWGHVYTVEIIRELADSARTNLEKTGYGDRVTVINADGSEGYPPESPYDRVLVTAAAPDIPKHLTEQLRTGGILVIPVGGVSFYQTLIRVRKTDSRLSEEDLGGVAFVPLTGKYGQRL